MDPNTALDNMLGTADTKSRTRRVDELTLREAIAILALFLRDSQTDGARCDARGAIPDAVGKLTWWLGTDLFPRMRKEPDQPRAQTGKAGAWSAPGRTLNLPARAAFTRGHASSSRARCRRSTPELADEEPMTYRTLPALVLLACLAPAALAQQDAPAMSAAGQSIDQGRKLTPREHKAVVALRYCECG